MNVLRVVKITRQAVYMTFTGHLLFNHILCFSAMSWIKLIMLLYTNTDQNVIVACSIKSEVLDLNIECLI